MASSWALHTRESLGCKLYSKCLLLRWREHLMSCLPAVRSAKRSEALGQLHLLELLLLEHEAKLRNEDADHERHDVVHALHVLQDDVALVLSEAAHVRIAH